MVRVLHRACALVVVLALLGVVPGGTSSGCTACSADCPMHHRASKLGCHHGRGQASGGTVVPDGQSCLGPSTCGHAQVAAPVLLRAVVGTVARVEPLLVTEDLAMLARMPHPLHAPRPPHGPPRSVVV